MKIMVEGVTSDRIAELDHRIEQARREALAAIIDHYVAKDDPARADEARAADARAREAFGRASGLGRERADLQGIRAEHQAASGDFGKWVSDLRGLF